ncbi:MAG: SGNH/GDSL hydrolase family protein [Lentisphaerae bacterium]|nr:SGNH/GDSL hydrolase family protein [Lentisphaerota bacterium]
MKRMLWLIFAGALFMLSAGRAEEEAPDQMGPKRDATSWISSYAFNANDYSLPRILLVGDSICKGYQQGVCQGLAGIATVSVFTTSQCLCDRSYLRALAYYLDEYDYAAIHINNGLHSLKSDRTDWERRLRAAIALIREREPGTPIIWASTTPSKDPATTQTVKALNAIAAQVVTDEKIPTNDLFALMDPMDRATVWRDIYHVTAEGSEMLAAAVSAALRETLNLETASARQAKAALEGANSEMGPDGKLTVTNK